MAQVVCCKEIPCAEGKACLTCPYDPSTDGPCNGLAMATPVATAQAVAADAAEVDRLMGHLAEIVRRP